MKWALIAGALLVSILFDWTERDRGRYVPCAECGGILDSRTGTIYSGEALRPQKIGQPYWSREALTAMFQKAECEEDPWDKYRTLDFQPEPPDPLGSLIKHLPPPNKTTAPRTEREAAAPCHLGIRFVVKNDTPEDVHIEHGNVIWPWAAASGTFDRTGVYGARVREDVSVPAGLSATLQVLTNDLCAGQANNWDACLRQDFAKTGSLLVFVKGTRDEIELPLR